MYTKFVGISAETAALIERLRLSPQESEDDILKRTLDEIHSQSGPRSRIPLIGCDLGEGAILHEGEKLYLFRHKASRYSGKPEAIAVAQGGNLHLFGQRVEKSKGSIVQPALKQWQERNNDRNEQGELVSLNAWLYWYVDGDGKLASAAELRIPKMVSRRRRATTVSDPALVESTVEGVGLDF